MRLARQEDANRGQDGDGDQRNWPHRLVPARPNRDDDRQNECTQDKSVDDVVKVNHSRMGQGCSPDGN